MGEVEASDRARTLADLARLERLRAEVAKRADTGQARLLLFGRSGFDPDLTAAASKRPDVELVALVRLHEGD